jgi:hypothetical protein
MNSAAARAHLGLLDAHLRIDRVGADVGRGRHQPADLGRVLGRGVERHPAAEGVAHQVRGVQPEVVDERGDVIGHEPDVERSVDVGGAAVALQVDDDDLAAFGQGGKGRPEHLARAEPAVQQEHRPPGPMGLEVEVDAVDLGVLAVAVRLGCPITGRHGAAPHVLADASDATPHRLPAGRHRPTTDEFAPRRLHHSTNPTW